MTKLQTQTMKYLSYYINHCNKIKLTSMMILPRGAPSADMSKKTLVVIVFEEFDKEFLNENRKKVLQS